MIGVNSEGEKKRLTEKGSWSLIGFRLKKKQSLATISVLGPLTQTALHREACAGLPACTVFLSPEPALKKVSWNPISTDRIEHFPFNQNCTDPTNHSSSILTNHDSVFWINQTARLWCPHLYEARPIRDQGRDFCSYKPMPRWLWSPPILST